jgi:putative FmdB family regulatory protein
VPIYDYDCTSCGRRIEVFHGIHAPGPGTCEVCGGTMRKAMSPPAIVFKGSGWAKVDARSGSAARPAASSKPDVGGADAPGGTGAEGGDAKGGEAKGGSGQGGSIAAPSGATGSTGTGSSAADGS